MIRVKELRLSFVCPANGLIGFATQIDSIRDGKAYVSCRACNGRHVINPAEDDATVSDLGDVIENLESQFGEIVSAADEAESAASILQDQVKNAENSLSRLRNAVKAAA